MWQDLIKAKRVHGGDKFREEHPDYMVLVGIASKQVMKVFGPTRCNAMRCILERIFFVKLPNGQFAPPAPPQPVMAWVNGDLRFTARMFNTCRRFQNRVVSAVLSQCEEITPMTRKEFVDSSPLHKKKQTEAVVRGMAGHDAAKEDFDISLFTKEEKVDVSVKEDAIPRPVSPRKPEAQVELGCYTRPKEKELYAGVNSVFKHTVVVKGMNAQVQGALFRADYDAFDAPVALSFDANRFDEHCGVQALRYEHRFYTQLYKGDRKLSRILNYQLSNSYRCQTRDGWFITFKRQGVRASGDMNTALGNVLIMCSMMYVFLEGLGIKYRLKNNGDDSVVFVERRHAALVKDATEAFFARYGYSMRVDDVTTVFERVNFCQTNPVWNGEEWVMCRNPMKAISKDTVMLHRYSKKYFEMWRKSVGMGGSRLCKGIPVMAAFYDMMKRGSNRRVNFLASKMIGTGFYYLGVGMCTGSENITEEARYSFWRAFGIAPAAQRYLERVFSNTDVVNPDMGPQGLFANKAEIQLLLSNKFDLFVEDTSFLDEINQ
jgi:hypothetical protein